MLEDYALSTNDEEWKKAIANCLDLVLRLGIDIEKLVENRRGYTDAKTEILKRLRSIKRH